jgi:Fe-S cluster biogenesis protein NfuA
MFIQTEETPNPRTLKFLPGRDVLGAGAGRDFTSPEAAETSPLASSLLIVEGVERVYLGPDFITVTKSDELDWPYVKPLVLATIMDHYVAGRPTIIEEGSRPEEIVYEGEAAEIVHEIKELIEARVRPAVARDGGDIVFHSWDHDEGVVRLVMKGSCSGCPSSSLTLKQGIEGMLKHYIPEVNRVEQAPEY